MKVACRMLDATVGRTSWEGGQRKLEALIIIDPERTPAEVHFQLPEFLVRLGGGALELTVARYF